VEKRNFMEPSRLTFTRRTALRLIAGGAAATALAGVAGLHGLSGPPAVEAAPPGPVEPQGGAGVFDVDPDQSDVSQDPNTTTTGDIDALPEDMDF
jgi:hypothetical protein